MIRPPGALVLVAADRPPMAAVTGELLTRVWSELPMMAGLGEREQLLAAAWLTSLTRPGLSRHIPATCGRGLRG